MIERMYRVDLLQPDTRDAIVKTRHKPEMLTRFLSLSPLTLKIAVKSGYVTIKIVKASHYSTEPAARQG